MALERIFDIFRKKDTAHSKTPIEKASFFRDPVEFMALTQTPPSSFILRLPDQYLMIQIAGAARDSFTALEDQNRAGRYLDILKSDFWEKNGFKGQPKQHVAEMVAFLLKIDGHDLGGEKSFLDFCRENGIDVNENDIEEAKKLYKKTDKKK